MDKSHATTILCVKKGDNIVMMSDGQVTLGDMICKNNAKKVRKINDGKILVGFAGSVADCLTMIDRLDKKLQEYSNQLLRSVIELAKDWRMDKYTRHLEASLIIADKNIIIIATGSGEVMEVEESVASVGSGSKFAIAAAKALHDIPNMTAEQIAKKSMKIAGEMCIYSNTNFTIESI